MTQETKENGNYGSEGDVVDFKVYKTNVGVQFNKNTFKCNINNFIKNYIFYNPLRDESKLINYISKHNFDYYEKNPTLLCLFWNIDIIEEQIISKIPLNVFNIDLEQCDEKEQLQYYKEQCFLIKKIIKINDLMIDQIKLSEFDKNCWFKIYSFDEYVNFTSKPLVLVQGVGPASAKPYFLDSIYQSLTPYYQKITIPHGHDSSDLDQLLQKQNIKKHNSFYFVQKKPFIISINFYEEKIIISDCHLIFNENFVDSIGTNAFADYFTKDIILHSKLKYIDRIYRSNILIIFMALNCIRQKSEMTMFYQLVYKSNKLYLKYLKCGYVDVSTKKAVYYSPNDKLFLPSALNNNSGCQHVTAYPNHLSQAFPGSKRCSISYSVYKQPNGKNGSCSYSLSCSMDLGNITLYRNQQ